ncbi:MAG: PD-(D/E)XK nuclease family protein [Thermoanaerobaculia bacterium]
MRLIAIATAAETRLRRVESLLPDLADAGREILIVAPTRAAAADFVRRACPRRAGLFGIHRATLKQLAADLATRALAGHGWAPVTALGSEALAARAISIRSAAGELDYFEPVADAPGFARALAATLRELRTGDVDPDELAATGPPGRDLARLLKTYSGELARWSLADSAQLYSLATDEIERGAHRLIGLPLVLLDLSPTIRAHRRLLQALVARAPAAVATAVSGDASGIEALREVFDAEPEDLDLQHAGSMTRLERLRRRIFLPHLDVGEDDESEDPDSDRSVTFLSAPGEGRECVEIARRIRELAEDGIAFDRIAILLRDPATYWTMVEEALSRARIPAYFTRGTTRPNAAGRALLALLACKADGLSASRFAEYLSLGQVPQLDAGGVPPLVELPWVAQEGDQLVFKTLTASPSAAAADDETVDGDPVIAGTLCAPQRWERLLVDASVLGGEDRWRRRLAGLAAEARLQLEDLEDGDDHPRRQRLERRLEQLGHLERFALPVVAALAALPDEGTWGEWLDRLSDLCGRVLRQPEQVLKVLAELRPMEQIGPVTLDQVRRVLEERLGSLHADPPERPYGRVFVATIAEARGRVFEAVFVPGLAEGTFPRRASEDPLLLDASRLELGSGKGACLPTQRERVEDERLLLRIAAGAAASRLVASYPNLDTLQGRSRVPSFYALDLLRAAEGRLPDLGQLEEYAAAASQSLLGWPAPRTPAAAVDDAEYDLSVLAELLRGRAEDVESRGRYLLESNDRLERSLRARWFRWRPGFSPADGVVDPDEATREALEPHRLRQRSYSATALQHFAACPYRFLLAAVHKLRPRERAVRIERLDPLTRGSLFHKVQFELFRELEERGLLPMRGANLAALLELADRVLDRVASRAAEDLAPAIPRVWTSEIESLRTDLRGWIDAVVQADEPWRPSHFELSFGLGGEVAPPPSSIEAGAGGPLSEPVQKTLGFELPAADNVVRGPWSAPAVAISAGPWGAGDRVESSDAVILDGRRLRGAIDLVETHLESGSLRITDHKTGAAPRQHRRLVVGGGETLQPILYALAAENLLGAPVEAGRLFFCTRRGGYQVVEVPVDDANREAAALVLEVVDRGLRDGFLPAAPRDGACEFCDYHSVCGPREELRIRRKHPQRLQLLGQLRNLP